ncbi:hypothetical protein [Spirochaeta isovalerica]|uniref:Uncharacterized protein n=1 Tax=Spirochaeta isovalerica TaxID=150 RepID=A0A841RGI2_9SPIO|nr:hypothetical protein [Spirochaeta isovalerica]MBB6482676.1 hypothetical protein [Spirochaeta isovalerica]
MKCSLIKVATLLFVLFFILNISSCVSTPPAVSPGEEIAETPADSKPDYEADESVGADSNQIINSGIIYSSLDLSEGPLLLGSTEYMNGPVVEFSILYTVYFALSGIDPPLSGYNPGKGTRWQVDSNKLNETVYFERALLSRDDEEKSWWFFQVEGNGFERTYEFLVNKEWKLLEMRYSTDSSVESYKPTVDENSNLYIILSKYELSGPEKVKVETPLGDFQADYYSAEGVEVWKVRRVTGSYIKTHFGDDSETNMTATLLEEKNGYETQFNSY